MVIVAQLVRASDCGSEGRGFESHLSPLKDYPLLDGLFFALLSHQISHQYISYIFGIPLKGL